jgi:hypothetical protein
LVGVVLDDAEVGGGIRHSEPVTPANATGAIRCISSPRISGICSSAIPVQTINDREMIGERHRQLIHKRISLTGGRELWKVAAHCRWAIENLRRVRDLFPKVDSSGLASEA